MPGRDTRLIDEAFDMLREADRLHRQFMTLALGRAGPCWEPPIDVIEDAHGFLVRVALPGVDAGDVEIRADGARLSVVGHRPPAITGAAVHRLEIPYGRFERTIDLPAGRYELVERSLSEGCLVMKLRRLA
ncbi:MAG: Hsp20/alpha crystallin family protein [Burkholderiales bacterium]